MLSASIFSIADFFSMFMDISLLAFIVEIHSAGKTKIIFWESVWFTTLSEVGK